MTPAEFMDWAEHSWFGMLCLGTMSALFAYAVMWVLSKLLGIAEGDQ